MNRRVLIGCHTSMRLPVHSWSVRNKMAEAKRVFSEDEFSSALAKAITNFKYSSLKEEQIECVRRVICFREDVLAVLPSGFGKSVIFQIIPNVLECLRSESVATRKFIVCVISPLQYILQYYNTLLQYILTRSSSAPVHSCSTTRPLE